MSAESAAIATPEALQRFLSLKDEAAAATVARFDATYPEFYRRFGQRGRAACRQDIEYHLEFLETRT